jgi:hypothetical protein
VFKLNEGGEGKQLLLKRPSRDMESLVKLFRQTILMTRESACQNAIGALRGRNRRSVVIFVSMGVVDVTHDSLASEPPPRPREGE